MLGRTVFIFAALLLAFSAPAVAQEVRYVESATDLDGSAKCNQVKELIITRSSGPCDSADIPDTIHVGSEVAVNGKVKRINFIQANLVTRDMPSLGLKNGQWTCVAVEKEKYLPERDNAGWWVYIPHCQPQGGADE